MKNISWGEQTYTFIFQIFRRCVSKMDQARAVPEHIKFNTEILIQEFPNYNIIEM